MTGVPAATPVRTPVPVTIVAKAVLLLLHVPPDVALVSVAEAFTHTAVAPLIAPGVVITVTVLLTRHPAVSVYVIFVVPAAMPVAIPELAFIVAVGVLLLLHVPPVVALVNASVVPVHIVAALVIAGNTFMVTVVVRKQPEARL